MRLWGRICEDLRDFGRGFERICETLGEDSQDFARENSLGVMSLWERIRKDCKTLL